MTQELVGQHAIVVGGSRGIGLAIARQLATKGAQVSLIARTPTRLIEAQSELAAEGLFVATQAVDITDPQSVAAGFASALAAQSGRVDILVNTAALPADQIRRAPIEEFDEEDLRIQLDTKLYGFLRTIRAVAPAMKAAGYGRIVNIGGQSAFQTGSISATVRNLAVLGVTTNLADELGPFGITVNLVHPGFTLTERTPEIAQTLGRQQGIPAHDALDRIAKSNRSHRLNTAEDLAQLVGFLASPQGASLNGESLYAGAGLRNRTL